MAVRSGMGLTGGSRRWLAVCLIAVSAVSCSHLQDRSCEGAEAAEARRLERWLLGRWTAVAPTGRRVDSLGKVYEPRTLTFRLDGRCQVTHAHDGRRRTRTDAFWIDCTEGRHELRLRSLRGNRITVYSSVEHGPGPADEETLILVTRHGDRVVYVRARRWLQPGAGWSALIGLLVACVSTAILGVRACRARRRHRAVGDAG